MQALQFGVLLTLPLIAACSSVATAAPSTAGYLNRRPRPSSQQRRKLP